MKWKWFLLLLCVYLLAFFTNFMTSIKHPDLHGNLLQLCTSSLLALVLLFVIQKMKNYRKCMQWLKSFLLVGIASGVIIYITEATIENTLLDILASIRYPFYFVFTTSLFGFNYLIDLSYDVFALLLSGVYTLLLIVASIWKG